MAVKGREKEILPQGTNVDNLSKGSWVCNLERFESYWKVRAGFGQFAQFDTSLAFDNVNYKNHLGSTVMKTNFGHEQILSVFQVETFTGQLFKGDDAKKIGQYADLYLVTIYDVTTDELWEEVLHTRTSDELTDLEERHGYYETNRSQNFDALVQATNKEFFFEEFDDIMYFGNKRTGLLAYIPATFRGNRNKQLDSVNMNDWAKGYSESCLIVKAIPSEGQFSDAYAYFSSTEFPKPDDITALLGRLVYVDGRSVFFSDIGNPTSIIADNFVTVPSENQITAVEELNGNLLLFTKSETFLYQPTQDVIVSAGRLTKVSEHVGCVSSNALTKAEGSLVWVDSNSVWSTTNGLNIQDMGTGIRSFWREFISNPLTHYYQESGFSDVSQSQPSIIMQFEEGNVNVAYDNVRRQLLITVPEQNMTLVFSGGWGIWNYESVAAAGNSVHATRNINNPWLLSGERDLYLVGSIESTSIIDETDIAGVTTADEDYTIDSYYILKYGLGGALDRSLADSSEDDRNFSGKYYQLSGDIAGSHVPAFDNAYYIDEWEKVTTNFEFVEAHDNANTRTHLLPLSVVFDNNQGTVIPDFLELVFRFDNTHWVPVFKDNPSGQAEIEAVIPHDRLPSVGGYSPKAPTKNISEIQCYDSTTDSASEVGDEIRIYYSGSNAAHVHSPGMNLTERHKHLLMKLPFKNTATPTSHDVISMGIQVVSASINKYSGLVNTFQHPAEVYVWQQAQPVNSRYTDNDKVQAIDWSLKTEQVGLKGAQQIKARGLYLKVRPRGTAQTATTGSNSIFGQINTVVASDWKGWSSQIVDYVSGSISGSVQHIRDITGIRTRMKNVSNDPGLAERVFNLSGSWGNAQNSSHGNYLVDDEEYNTVSISDSTRGEHIAWLLFGHTRNKGEGLAIDSMKVDLRVIGGRRRRGR